MAALADFMGMDRTSLTRNLRPPERKRWVRITQGDEDRRVRNVEITPAGIVALRKALPAWRDGAGKRRADARRPDFKAVG